MKTINILIADDHEFIRECYNMMISAYDDIKVVGEASDGKEAIKKAKKIKPDVILMDINMPIINGLDACTKIQEQNKDIAIIMISQYREEAYVQTSRDAGCSGYLSKDSSSEDIIAAIREVAQGNQYYKKPPSTNGAFLALFMALTKREREIIRLIAKGLSSKEIADKLFLSTRTVDTHRTNIAKKTKTKNVAQLINYAKVDL